MSGLIEVADREFDRLNRETALESGVELYVKLEAHYYKLTARRPDPELSLEVIRLLMPLMGPTCGKSRNGFMNFSRATRLNCIPYTEMQRNGERVHSCTSPKCCSSMNGLKPTSSRSARFGILDSLRLSSSVSRTPSASHLTDSGAGCTNELGDHSEVISKPLAPYTTQSPQLIVNR